MSGKWQTRILCTLRDAGHALTTRSLRIRCGIAPDPRQQQPDDASLRRALGTLTRLGLIRKVARGRYTLLLLLLVLMAGPVWGACPPVKRSAGMVRQFRKLHPCPATQKTTGACPGWVVDHIIPLCLGPQAGGVDTPANMQWHERGASLVKDKIEWQMCRARPRPCPHQGD
jgi:hypothetical protein